VDTIGLICREYEHRFPNDELQFAFFHGGFPDKTQLAAASRYPIRLSAHPIDITQDLAKRLQEAGGVCVELEAMTFDPHILRTCRRGYTINRVRTIGSGLSKMGFKVGVHLVPGLPAGDAELAIRDAERVSEMPWVDFVRIWPALGFHGAEITQWAKNGSWIPWDTGLCINVVAEMMETLRESNTPVIRVGIQPGQDIPVRAHVGPYHPNLRGEVESQRFGSRLIKAMSKVKEGDHVTIQVNEKDVTWLKGTSNINIKRCQRLYRPSKIQVETNSDTMRGSINIMVSDGSH
jgi:histone acetyltransferase (RNA polymerase elongator complex component)